MSPPDAPQGYVLLYRKFFDHPYWTEPRTFSKAEAWLDCWANMAAFTDHRKIVGTRQVKLRRGEFLASDRFLMKRWGWSRGKVRRWIEAAREANEIRPTRETSDGTIYLVVNFEDMQPGDTSNGTTDSTSNGPATDQQRTKDNEGNEGNTVPKKKRASRLPDDWEPNDTHRRIADEEGVNMGRELMKFKDHAEAKDRKQKDWDAAFRMWLRNARQFGAPTSKPESGRPPGRWIPGMDG